MQKSVVQFDMPDACFEDGGIKRRSSPYHKLGSVLAALMTKFSDKQPQPSDEPLNDGPLSMSMIEKSLLCWHI